MCYRPWSGSAEAEPFDGGRQGTQDATGMPGCLRGCGLDRARQFRPHSAGPKVTALRASLQHHHVCCFLRPAATALRFLRMQSRLACDGDGSAVAANAVPAGCDSDGSPVAANAAPASCDGDGSAVAANAVPTGCDGDGSTVAAMPQKRYALCHTVTPGPLCPRLPTRWWRCTDSTFSSLQR